MKKLAISLLCFFISPTVFASLSLPMSLAALYEDAELVFWGECVQQNVELSPKINGPVTHTTFKVKEIYKGTQRNEHTMTQIGGALPGQPVTSSIIGLPSFEPGKEYIVFLPKASKLGLSSPIGLSQGQFMVRQQDGSVTVSNGSSLTTLMPLQARTLTAGPSTFRKAPPSSPHVFKLNELTNHLKAMGE